MCFLSVVSSMIFSTLSGMYLEVRGPIIDPMKMPINSAPMRPQWTTRC
mgnify:CR=1 FL=1